MLLVSFHGIPKRYFMAGDPYHCHCIKTARLLKEELKWSEEKILVESNSSSGIEILKYFLFFFNILPIDNLDSIVLKL